MAKLPFRDFAMSEVWLELSLIAQDVIAWTKALALDGAHARSEPKRLRYRLPHVAGRLAFHARQAILHLDRDWPWASELARTFQRLAALPPPTRPGAGKPQHLADARGPRRFLRTVRHGPAMSGRSVRSRCKHPSALMPSDSPGRVRDPVHGYITFTAIERVLLDHPVAQRLRQVTQSAAAQLVFPEMRVSRFAHSLGAMHLASRFLASTLRNSPDDMQAELVGSAKALVDEVGGLGPVADDEAFMRRQGLLADVGVPANARLAVLLIEQGLRLAALVHDLGHLPYSHDFEDAIDTALRRDEGFAAAHGALAEQGTEGVKLHERLGYHLSDLVENEVYRAALTGTPIAKSGEIALLIARRILHTPAVAELQDPSPTDLFVSWLHELVAGELDVDRSDYVLRDVRHYGLVSADYDVDRLIDNLVVLRSASGGYETAVLPQGVPAAESFFVARLRMYQWGVYHHKVQQAAAGLRVSIEHLLTAPGAHRHAIDLFLADLEVIAGNQGDAATLHRFADYDDVWWFGEMRAALNQGVPPDVAPWLSLFCRRRPGPKSLWKRPSDFPVDRRAWNERLPGRDDVELKQKWEDLTAELQQRGVLVVRLGFTPWDATGDGESMFGVWNPRTQERLPLTALSPLVAALADAWASDLHILAFVATEGAMSAAGVLEFLEPALLSPKE